MLFDKEEEGWRNKLPPHLDQQISELVRETKKHKRAYMDSDSKANAQLWISLAIINKKLNKINEGLERIQEGMEKAGKAMTFREEKMKKIMKALEEL